MDNKQAEQINREEACKQLSSEGRKHFNLIEFDANERLVTEIRKDPVGLVIILLIGGLVIILSLIAAIFISTANLDSFLNTTNLNAMRGIGVAAALLMALLGVIGTFIGAFLYRSNVIYVTSEKIAQVLYTSLFNRKISQLSIGDVQDVTVTQKGIPAHIFNYGVLVIETAGEQQNYTFTFVPDPYSVSKSIVGSHEVNLTQYGN